MVIASPKNITKINVARFFYFGPLPIKISGYASERSYCKSRLMYSTILHVLIVRKCGLSFYLHLVGKSENFVLFYFLPSTKKKENNL